MADIMSWRDDMLAMGAKRRVRAPGAAIRTKTKDQVVAATNRNGSAAAFDLKQAADTAREYMQYRSIARSSATDPNKTKQLPAKAMTAAQTAPGRVTAKPVASEAISEQKSTSDAEAELTARAERAREKLWHAGKQKDAQQKALQGKMKQIEAEAAQEAKQEALAKAEAARKAVEELLAEEEQAAHQAAAKKAKKDRRKAKKQQQQQQEEEQLQRRQQQEEELLRRQQQEEEEQLQRRQQREEELLQRQQQQEEEQQRVQHEMRHQQQLQEEQELQQQKQAKQQAQKLQQELQKRLQPQVQVIHESQTRQEWQEQQRQRKQQQQKQQRNVEQPTLQVHTQQACHAAGGSSTGTAANTVSASKGNAAGQTEPLLSPELMHVKQSNGLASGHRQTAKTVGLDHAEPSHCVIGQHTGGVPTVDHMPATGQQKRFAAPHRLLCCPITQVCCFLLI